MHFLRDREKIGCALDDAPFGAEAKAVHKQGERGKHLRHATAVVRGIEICDAQAFQFSGFLANSLNGLGSNKRLVIFNLSDVIMGHL